MVDVVEMRRVNAVVEKHFGREYASKRLRELHERFGAKKWVDLSTEDQETIYLIVKNLTLSDTKLSIDDLRKQINPLRTYIGRDIRHVKTDKWYRITGIHFREADMSIQFSYETTSRSPISFVRPISELKDGRFSLR